jgi:uncharacterized membrane protein
MPEMIQIPVKEYEAMKEKISLLTDTALLEKMNRLIEILYEERYGLYFGDQTHDLTEAAVQKNWPLQNTAWDNV